MQLTEHFENGTKYSCEIPAPRMQVAPGLCWGDAGVPFTPAFWRFVSITRGATTGNHSSYRLGRSLQEEVVACLLGGYGIRGELGVEAFRILREQHVFDSNSVSAEFLEDLLKRAFWLGAKQVRYRFPRQKAKYIAAALACLRCEDPPEGGRALRNWLTRIPGIGNKTASWVARNWADATDVAILDIHIHRAGVLLGLFEANDDVSKCYSAMEASFLLFADKIGVPPNMLDSVIWNEMRSVPTLVRQYLTKVGVKPTDRCGLPAAHQRRPTRNDDLFAIA